MATVSWRTVYDDAGALKRRAQFVDVVGGVRQVSHTAGGRRKLLAAPVVRELDLGSASTQGQRRATGL